MLNSSTSHRTGTWEEGGALQRHLPTPHALRPLRQPETQLGACGFLREMGGGSQTAKGGSNSSLALPVWTSVEEAMARNNPCGFTFLDLCQHYFSFSGFCMEGGLARSDLVAEH